MRDDHDGMLEFIDAYEKDEHFYAVVEFRSKKYQFGISLRGYKILKRIMQLRPFDMMPGRNYRYFYLGSNKGSGDNQFLMNVRVELDKDARKEKLSIPQDLHANLLWFARLENMSEAEYLEI
jgi:hypothetical protein